ncbi:MAG TPA: glycosyltransferase [Verrucomicrobiae bacterium]|nr:glycosyltransferase [Verrucomicrobiae bacterium]
MEIYADRPQKAPRIHADVEKFHLLEKTRYAPRLPGNPLARTARACALAARHFGSAPRQVAGALNPFRFGRQALSFKLLHHAAPFLPRRPAYDIVHAHFGQNGIKAQALRDLRAVSGKLITTFHGYDVTIRPRGSKRNMYARLFKKGDWFTWNSRYLAERLLALGCPPERLSQMAMGVDTRAFVPPERRPVRSGAVSLLTVARLVEFKGLENALRAVARLVARYPGLKYRVIGDGPLRSSLEGLRRQLGLEMNVEFMGAQGREEVIAAYAQSDLFVLPSVVASDGSTETQGVVLIEAQAMGLPVVASRVGGIPDSLTDGVSGFLVPERDSEALAWKLAELIERRESWPEIGMAGQRFVKEKFDLRKLNDELEALYRQVLGQ